MIPLGTIIIRCLYRWSHVNESCVTLGFNAGNTDMVGIVANQCLVHLLVHIQGNLLASGIK